MKSIIKNNIFKVYLMLSGTLFTLISGAYSQTFKVNGSAVDYGNGLVKLTSYNQSTTSPWTQASAWDTTKIDLAMPFDKTFDMFFGCEKGPNGGDGITFTFQNQGLNALGAGGGFLGLGGITPAISIEFDTYDGTLYGGFNEMPEDHIAIDRNGDVNNNNVYFEGKNGPVTVQPVINSRDLEDCAQNSNDYYTIRIVWDPATTRLKLYEEGVLTLTYTEDIVNTIFGGNSKVYWGFTGATGLASNEQWIAPHGAIIPWQCSYATSCCVPFTLNLTGPATICNNPITIGISDSYSKYKWSTGDTTSSINVDAPGKYVVTVLQDQQGSLCPAADTFTIVPTGPTATISGSNVICNDGSVSPVSVTLTGVAPWTLIYAVDSVVQAPVNLISSSPYVIQAKSPHTYTLVSVTDNSGCKGVTYGEASVSTFSGLPEGHDTTFTAPGTAYLQVNDEGGTYNWYDASSGGNLLNTGTSFTTPVLNGLTTYYVENASLPPYITKSIAYINHNDGTGNQSSNYGVSNASFVKFTANKDFIFDTVTCEMAVADPAHWAGSEKVSVLIQDLTEGTSFTKDSVNISNMPGSVLEFKIPLGYNCVAGHNYQTSYSGGGVFYPQVYWQLVPSYPETKDQEVTLTDASTMNSNPSHAYPGLFDWKIRWINPATNCGRTPVTAIPCPAAVLSGDTTICNDVNSKASLLVNLTGVGPWTIVYEKDGVVQSPITGIKSSPYIFQAGGSANIYTLNAVSYSYIKCDGCLNNFSGSAQVSVFPDLPKGHDTTFVIPGEAFLSVEDKGCTYNWYDAPVGGNLVYSGTMFTTPVLSDTTTYYVECIKSSEVSCGRTPITAFALPDLTKFFIPNLITPNNDNENDVFKILGLPVESKLTIYNRWGKRLYESNDYNNEWSGEGAVDGVYYYNLMLPIGKSYNGWVQIVRSKE